jgi:hypothetical protein
MAHRWLIEGGRREPLVAVVDGFLHAGHIPHLALSQHLALMLGKSKTVPFFFKVKNRAGKSGPRAAAAGAGMMERLEAGDVRPLEELFAENPPRWRQDAALFFRAMLFGPTPADIRTPYWLEIGATQKRGRGQPPGGNPLIHQRNKVYANHFEYRTKVDDVSVKDVFAEMDQMHGDTTDSGHRDDTYWHAIREWGGKSPFRALPNPQRPRRIPKEKKGGRR